MVLYTENIDGKPIRLSLIWILLLSRLEKETIERLMQVADKQKKKFTTLFQN